MALGLGKCLHNFNTVILVKKLKLSLFSVWPLCQKLEFCPYNYKEVGVAQNDLDNLFLNYNQS